MITDSFIQIEAVGNSAFKKKKKEHRSLPSLATRNYAWRNNTKPYQFSHVFLFLLL